MILSHFGTISSTLFIRPEDRSNGRCERGKSPREFECRWRISKEDELDSLYSSGTRLDHSLIGKRGSDSASPTKQEALMGGPQAERREAPRATVMFTATVHSETSLKPVKVRNLSSKGALVEGEARPEKGATILFRRNGLLVRGEIVWAEGRRAGIRFHDPLSISSSLRRVSRPKPSSEPRSRRPGLKCRPLKECDKRVLERWVNFGPNALGD